MVGAKLLIICLSCHSKYFSCNLQNYHSLFILSCWRKVKSVKLTKQKVRLQSDSSWHVTPMIKRLSLFILKLKPLKVILTFIFVCLKRHSTEICSNWLRCSNSFNHVCDSSFMVPPTKIHPERSVKLKQYYKQRYIYIQVITE